MRERLTPSHQSPDKEPQLDFFKGPEGKDKIYDGQTDQYVTEQEAHRLRVKRAHEDRDEIVNKYEEEEEEEHMEKLVASIIEFLVPQKKLSNSDKNYWLSTLKVRSLFLILEDHIKIIKGIIDPAIAPNHDQVFLQTIESVISSYEGSITDDRKRELNLPNAMPELISRGLRELHTNTALAVEFYSQLKEDLGY